MRWDPRLNRKLRISTALSLLLAESMQATRHRFRTSTGDKRAFRGYYSRWLNRAPDSLSDHGLSLPGRRLRAVGTLSRGENLAVIN